MLCWRDDSLFGSEGANIVVFFSEFISSDTITAGGSLGALASIEAWKLAYSTLSAWKALSICLRFSGDMLTLLFFSTPLLTFVPLDRMDITLPLRLVLWCPLVIGFSSTPSLLPSGKWHGRHIGQQTCRERQTDKEEKTLTVKSSTVQSLGNKWQEIRIVTYW